jgi:hypothetical protein
MPSSACCSAPIPSALVTPSSLTPVSEHFTDLLTASPLESCPAEFPGVGGGGQPSGCLCPALGDEVGLVGGVDLVHGAGPVGEVGLVEQ